MKRPCKKRIKLRGDGYYYPQYRWFGMWFDYDLTDAICSESTSFRYACETGARRFLQNREDLEIDKIEMTKSAKIIKWNGTK
jgi:hypothetical protein